MVKTILKTAMLIIVLIILAAGQAYSGDKGNIDVVLVIDSSGSMKRTDPMSLRIPAAKLFISLLDESDRAAVISFSDKGYPIRNLTPVDSEANKDMLFRSTEKITSNGLYTNLYDALETGFQVLSADKREDGSGIIVLMSDGMMDTGDPAEDGRLLDKLKTGLAGTLADSAVKVYSIAFTGQSDQKLLQKISKQTGGFYNLALTDRELHLIFTSIFESLKTPEMLPMSENGFLIDKSVAEVTIVVTKESRNTKIRLNSPDGEGLSSTDERADIKWFVSDTFDMITVKEPAEGRWEILFSTGRDNKAYIITDLKLQSNFDQMYSTFGDPLDIKIWLEKEGNVIQEHDVLDKIEVYIELTGPDGKTTRLSPFRGEDGMFLRKIAPFTPGNYDFKIVARGKTFERAKSYVFNVADARESKEDVMVQREKKKSAEEPVEQNITKEDETEGIPWGKVILQFVSINILIGVIILFYIKRSRIKALIPSGRIRSLIKKKEGEINEEDDDKVEKEVEEEVENQPVKEEEHPEQESHEEEPSAEDKNEIALEDNEHEEDTQDEEEVQEEKIQEITPEEEADRSGDTKPEEKENITTLETTDEQDKKTGGSDTEDSPDTQVKGPETDTDQVKQDEEIAEEKPDEAPQDKDGTSSMDGNDAEDTIIAEDSVQDKQEDNVDDMWKEALQQQEAGAEVSETREEPEDEDGTSTEGMMDSRADRGKNLKTMGRPQDASKEHAADSEEETSQEQGNSDENIDDMWREALQQQDAATEGKVVQVPEEKEVDAETDNSEDGQHDTDQIVDINEINSLLEAEKNNQSSEEGPESG